MNKEKLIYLIDNEEVKRKKFYDTLELCSTNMFPCCIYEIESDEKEYRRIKRELLYGFVKKIAGVKFQIKRIYENSEVLNNEPR